MRVLALKLQQHTYVSVNSQGLTKPILRQAFAIFSLLLRSPDYFLKNVQSLLVQANRSKQIVESARDIKLSGESLANQQQ